MPDSNEQIIEQLRQEQIRQDWLGALACPGARRIFGRMIHNAAFNQSHYPGDALATAFNEGSRAVGLEIMKEIEAAKPGEAAALMAETLEEIRFELLREANRESDQREGNRHGQ